MNKTDLMALVAKGESSFVEFKRDAEDLKAETISEYIVCFSNAKGGQILLGVEDDGTITGLQNRFGDYGHWISQAVQGYVHPHVIVEYEEVPVDDLRVAVITVPMGVAKPYCKRKGKEAVERYFIRDVTRCRETDREELRRLFQASGFIHYEVTPVPRSALQDLSEFRLADYFRKVHDLELEELSEQARTSLLIDNQLLSTALGETACTLAGMLLFGNKDRVKRLVPQSGVTAVEFDSAEADIAGKYRKEINGPLPSLRGGTGEIVEAGVIDEAVEFVLRVTSSETITGTQRTTHFVYPPEVLREILVNAVAHRDYTIGGANISLALFPDRLEVESPGGLPNTITLEGMKRGARYHRNPMLADYLRDYNYLDKTSRGISRKIIKGMLAHNGKEPAFELRGESLRVTLWA